MVNAEEVSSIKYDNKMNFYEAMSVSEHKHVFYDYC